MIFPWRIIAKAILLRLLPPIFRATSIIFDVELPARRHYQQATSDYSGVPPTPIRSLPSFIDLHSGTPPEMPSAETTPVAKDSPLLKPTDYLKRRSSSSDSSVAGDTKSRSNSQDDGTEETVPPVGAGRGKRRTRTDLVKYDAEGMSFLTPTRKFVKLTDVFLVLTKVGVYSGIGFLCTWGAPYVFDAVERSIGL